MEELENATPTVHGKAAARPVLPSELDDSASDPIDQREVFDLLRDINRTRSVVVVEHDMAFVRALGVRVTVLHEGSVLSEGTIDHVSNDPKVIEVYLGR